MALDKEVISELLKNNGESAGELLRHLSGLLQISSRCHKTFSENPHYAPHLEKARAQGTLSPLTLDIIAQQDKLGPIGEAFLNPSYKEKNRHRP